jgi:ATP-binding cassette subfamily C (CFTR/MRP) protein 4
MLVLLAQAILVGLLAEYFVGELTSENTRNAFLYGVGIVICSILLSFLHPHAFIQGQQTGMIARIALTGTIYRKIFSLSLETVGETTIGRIINLASSDVQRIDVGLGYAPYVILSLVYIIAVLVILWVYLGLGPSALTGMGTMVLLIPVLYFLGKVYASIRLASSKYTDKRVKLMNEIISGIRVIKMYGWEYAFKEMISQIRRQILKYLYTN